MHIIQFGKDLAGAFGKLLRRGSAQCLRILDRLQGLVQAHFYARSRQERSAALRQAPDRLDTLAVDDRRFVARVPGPLVNVLKNVSMNRLQMGRVEFAVGSTSLGYLDLSDVGQRVFGHPQF